MAAARRREAWDHTAALMAQIRNVVGGLVGARAVDPDRYHPFGVAIAGGDEELSADAKATIEEYRNNGRSR